MKTHANLTLTPKQLLMLNQEAHRGAMSNDTTLSAPLSKSISTSLWPTNPLPPVTTQNFGTFCDIFNVFAPVRAGSLAAPDRPSVSQSS
jgi:hypothetical protein